MLSPSPFRRGAVDFASWIDQISCCLLCHIFTVCSVGFSFWLKRVQQVATLVALVPSRSWVTADGALAFNEPVGKERVVERHGAEGLNSLSFFDIPI